MKLTYKESGVDVAAAELLVESYKNLAAATSTRHVLSGVGGFAGFFSLPQGYAHPVLVACTDGVGTKLRLLIQAGCPEVAGMDAAAMCLNDLATCGAQPLFMLDYLAVGRLEEGAAKAVVSGFAAYCRQAGCALLGGETAEMPGFYPPGDFDVAGFALGVVEKEKLVDGSRCRPGDIVLGLASSGLHSNGFSLVRLLLERGLLDAEATYPGMGGLLEEELLKPTRLYLPLAQGLAGLGAGAMAHITGGGLPGNAARTLPRHLDMVLDTGRWPQPPIYAVMALAGVSRDELLATFNMGIGFTVAMAPDLAQEALRLCERAGIPAWQIGRLVPGTGKVKIDG